MARFSEPRSTARAHFILGVSFRLLRCSYQAIWLTLGRAAKAAVLLERSRWFRRSQPRRYRIPRRRLPPSSVTLPPWSASSRTGRAEPSTPPLAVMRHLRIVVDSKGGGYVHQGNVRAMVPAQGSI